jgi:SAM-dependent methyltransferase
MPSGVWWNLFYLFGRPRWDTGITPPELVELIEGGRVQPGRALDIGCGTGTNSVYLAQHGFEVVGTDVAWLAIRKARRKARDAGVSATFHVGEAVKLGTAAGPPLKRLFDLAVDIGCFHSLQSAQREAYASMLRRGPRQGGHYLLYAWGPRKLAGGCGAPPATPRDCSPATSSMLDPCRRGDGEPVVLVLVQALVLGDSK